MQPPLVADSGKMRCLLDLLLSAGIGEGSADYDATSFWAGDVPDGGFEGEEGGGVGEADESVREIREEKEKVRSGEERSDELRGQKPTPLALLTSLTPPSQEEKTKNKCVIFAQHTTALNAVEEHLLAPHLPTVRHLRLDGGVAAKDRYSIAKAFEEDDGIEVLLCTTKVGGLGLNLVSANICIFLEMDYNPMSDLQAMDRLHRIGQSRAVSVYRLVTRGTVEEKILKMQGVKVRVGDEIVSQENSSMWSLGTDRCELCKGKSD